MKSRLLLHICCGPCATEVVRRLAADYEVVGFYHNPNIHPEEEYWKRLAEVQRLAALWHVQVDTGAYDHAAFLRAVRGLENEPEGGRRCAACFRLRLAAAADAARANGCTVVASTLTIGRNKKASVINRIGVEACLAAGHNPISSSESGLCPKAGLCPESAPLRFLEADWKKQDGARHGVELSRELGLYRQTYCGCEFSGRRA